MAAAALIAGCGGSDDAAYDLWETDSCLLDKGYSPALVETDDPAAFRGEPGANGVLEIKTDGGGAVDIRFEDDAAAAIARAGLLEKSAVAAGPRGRCGRDRDEAKRHVLGKGRSEGR